MHDVTSSKPKSEPNAVSIGIKLTDDEITNGLAFKLVKCSQHFAKGQADAVHSDVGKIWLEFFLEWAMFGGTLSTLMRKRGWLKVPPYFDPPGFPNKQKSNS
ncbi:hypothetical protein [Cytobacillus firmus]|uniref:hypothetical protein n=1 Tax=Cytobacillus firmus TaxID=1399 RepID=UPI0024C1E639|nr:hypothetical protein [Cytobacillus firmus]WHY59884.1 hypothetical protein QNH42_14970 [Cytobacillus firmus]